MLRYNTPNMFVSLKIKSYFNIDYCGELKLLKASGDMLLNQLIQLIEVSVIKNITS